MMSRKSRILYTAAVVAAIVTTAFVFIACSSGGNQKVDVARFGVASAQAAEPISQVGTSPTAKAIEKAGAADKYIFTLFYKIDDAQTESVRTAIKSARTSITRKSETVEVNVSDQAEGEVVKKFNLGRATMPLVLVLAPNGAIMGGFPGVKVTEQVLIDAVGTRASEQTVKAIQGKNMVVLCAQNKNTSDNEAAMQGVEEFLKDPQYAGKVAVVSIDPADPAEAKFLSQIQMNAGPDVATTALLAPPGSVVASFKGATNKDQFVTAINSVTKGGCGAGQSCGGKPCGPAKGASPVPQNLTSTTVKASPTPVPTTISVQKQTTKTSPAPTTSNVQKQDTKKGK
jgi:hypothetical protein